MSEPITVVSRIDEVTRGVWHWRLQDDRIGGHTSAAHAVATSETPITGDSKRAVRELLERTSG